jgi:hypothetical protein
MAAANASDVLIETLIDWGVDTIFGIPGDGINGIIEALRTRQDRVRFIQVRHEEAAAFSACAYAKWTGKLGVCLATSGPGGIHLLNGLYDAKLDGQPVLLSPGFNFMTWLKPLPSRTSSWTSSLWTSASITPALWGRRIWKTLSSSLAARRSRIAVSPT